MRKVQCFAWVSPEDCLPPHGLDMSAKRDYEKVEKLIKAFKENGFDLNMPCLVGYPLDGKVQLLSGTHRHLAAKEANIKLPVSLWLYSDIECTWGTPEWLNIIADIPVKELMEYEIKDGPGILKYTPVKFEY